MVHSRWIGLLLLTTLACGSDNGSGPAPADGELPDAVPTAVGTPSGVAVSLSIGPGGGTLASDDGGLTLSVPAGALAADTEIGIQAVTNTAWGGLGLAYRLTPAGLRFASPATLTFAVPPALLAGSAPEVLNVAYQDDAGYWFVPAASVYDEGAATLTCTTMHFTDFSVIEQYRLVPATASVELSATLDLKVDVCFYQTIAEDEDAIMQVLTCEDSEEELSPLVELGNWSVNGITGGSSTVGTIVETGGNTARYQAPQNLPLANPVAVSVEVLVEGNPVLLVANLTLLGDVWTGVATGWYGEDERADATLTWHSTGVFGNFEFLAPTGFAVREIYSDPNCPQVSLDPDTGTIVEGDGLLMIDRSTQPPTFSWTLATTWDATYCYDCGPEYEVVCEPYTLSATFGDLSGELSANGTRIQGYLYDIENDIGYSFEFTR